MNSKKRLLRHGLESLEIRLVLDSTVVFNELMYHPLQGQESLEFVELHNQMAVDMDISKWSLQQGISFEFPEGTIVPGGGYLVLAKDPAALQQEGAEVVGPYEGSLSNQGERLELRDRNDRRMDVIDYDDGGQWPIAADGSGASLAKIDEDTLSRRAENWSSSIVVGGTPGAANFPEEVEPDPDVIQQLLTQEDSWKFDTSGSDLGTNWRSPDYDDSGWSGGEPDQQGPYFAGDARLVGATSEMVTGVSAAASSALASHDPIHTVDGSGMVGDAHVFSKSAGNMWVTTGTFFGLPPDLDPEITFDLGQTLSVDSMRVWNYNHVDVGDCCLNQGVALADIWVAGEDGNFSLLIENQVFDKAPGTETDFSQEIDLNGASARYIKIDVDTSDGVANYGNALNFVGLSEVQFFAEPPAGNTELSLGPPTHYFRKEFDFTEASDRTRLLVDLMLDDGAVVYLNGEEIARQNMPAGDIGFETTSMFELTNATSSGTLEVPSDSLVNGRNVLAVEVHQHRSDDPDMVFAMEMTSITSPRVPLRFDSLPVVINEVGGADSPADFFVELTTTGLGSVDVSGMKLVVGDFEHSIPAGTELTANDYLVVSPGAAYSPRAGNDVRLFSADRQLVLSAVEIDSVGRGQHADSDGLLFTSEETPGAANLFELRDEIVINEIMYNFRATAADPGTPPTFDTQVLMPFGAIWRYNQSGESLPANWAESSHPVGGNWSSGPGMLGAETAPLPSPGLNTEFDDPRANDILTYYLETDFDISQEQLDKVDQFQLRHVIDDGVIIYLNGIEVLRLNMPDGPVDHLTRASGSVNNAGVSEAVAIPTDLLVVGKNLISAEVHQRSASSSDVVFGLELYTGAITAPGEAPTSYQESDEEWIELYNRGTEIVDLSGWQLDDAVEFDFPAGTSLAPGSYLVVARDAEDMQLKYPEISEQIVGSFRGSLNNQTDRIVLLDANANPADVVEYYEDGQWPFAADGRGSSLELRDPDADNSRGLAWAASDESGKSSWKTYTYQGAAKRSSLGPDRTWEEFVMGMLADGVVLLDDISVIQEPNGEAIEIIQNGSFEGDTVGEHADKWRLIGNHRHSQVVVDPDDPNNKVLRFVSTGATEHMHNHAETTLKHGDEFVDIRNGFEYKISYKAKWVTGANLLNTRLYFNRLPRSTPIAQPENHGTPGRQNSTAEENIGPTYAEFGHSPVVPDENEAVTISVVAQDPDNVTGLDLWYSVEAGDWVSTEMNSVGGGEYRGMIPGQEADATVQFYVEGTDSNSVTSTYPRRGRDSRALYKVDDGLAADGGLHNFRMVLHPDDARTLHQTIELMSNDMVPATMIYNESEVFYEASVRLSGSQRARPFQPRCSFRIGFNADHLFRGVHNGITLDRSESTGFGQREHLYHHGMNHVGGLPTEYNDLFNIITPQQQHTGSAEAQLARYSDVFLDEQYENGSDGQLYEYELTYFPQQTVDRDPESRKVPNPDGVAGTPIRYLGDDQEDYRWAFLNKNNRVENDYSQLMEFTRVFGQSGDSFNNQIADVIDVDQWLRGFAFSVMTGHGDNYGADGSQHNFQIFERPSDNRFLFLPHDLDAFFDYRRALVGNQDLRKLIRVPDHEHMYYGHVHDMIQTTFNEQYMQRWTDHWRELLPRQRFDRHLTDLVRRSDYLMTQIERQAPDVEFAITSPATTVDESVATIEGNGWVNVREIRLAGSSVPLEVTWADVTEWQIDVPLAEGANPVTVEAYDFQGALIGTSSVTITSTVANPIADSLAITEINYHPAEPTAEERQQIANLDDDDFEFIELSNIGAEPLNLLGVQFDAGVSFTFPSLILGSGESTLVVRDLNAFQLRYGDAMRIAGEFASGRLDNAGERISLVDATNQTILDVTYNDADPWPVRADGVGATLELIDPAGTPRDQMGKHYQWRGSVAFGGSPGIASQDAVGVVINEVLTNTDLPLVDSIELANVTDSSIDISGWWLSDSAADLDGYRIPDGTILDAGQYIVFDEGDFNPTPETPGPNDIALNGSDGDDVWLIVPNENGQPQAFADDVRFIGSPTGESWGRSPNGSGRLNPMTEVTLGVANSTPRVGPIVISEINYHSGPVSVAALAIEPALTVDDLEFVEIINPTAEPVDLTAWRLRGAVDFNFADGTTLASGQVATVIGFDPADEDNATRLSAFRAHYQLEENVVLLGEFDGRLNDDSEKLQLRRPEIVGPNGDVVGHYLSDEVIYDDVSPWPVAADGAGQALVRSSLSGYGNAAQSWTAASPTPGFMLTTDADLDQDGQVDIADVDLLCVGINAGDAAFDLTGDGQANTDDLVFMIRDVLGTTRGDANLDGKFDSADLVTVFTVGEFEDEIAGNSTWADGDWNCDFDFTTSDLVVAFQDGGYISAARPAANGNIAAALLFDSTSTRDAASPTPETLALAIEDDGRSRRMDFDVEALDSIFQEFDERREEVDSSDKELDLRSMRFWQPPEL